MDLEILTFCKAATLFQPGDVAPMLHIEAAFTEIALPSFPMVLRDIQVAFRVRFSSDEDGSHVFRLVLTDIDGQSVSPAVEGAWEATAEADREYAWIPGKLTIPEIQIPAPLDLLASLFLDEEPLGQATLYVGRRSTPTQQ